jgi:hypothetical protein
MMIEKALESRKESKNDNKVIEILLKLNWQMEHEIQRLNTQLDETTNGIHMRGYLYKFRDREISFASKWGLRYFVLQGKALSYFVDDQEHRPRRTVDLVIFICKTLSSAQRFVDWMCCQRRRHI